MISFYKPSDAKSQEIDALLEGAKQYLDKKIADGEWNQRNIGWFRIDIEETPEMAFKEDKTDQMISGHGWRKMIGF